MPRSRRVTKGPVRVSGAPPVAFRGDRVACDTSVLDLATNRRWEIPMDEFHSVRALGSDHAAGTACVRPLAGASAVPLARGHQAFAIERGIVYSALPEDGPGAVTVLASPVEANVVRYGPVHLVWGRHGWWLFDGTAWRHHDWLDALPD